MVYRPTVFVVDDDPGALRSLCWLIQQADLPVRGFRSGREFLESYRPQEPGCLVLDVRMPEMDGLEVQKCLWQRGSGLPIIFITAHGDVPTCAGIQGGGLGVPGKTPGPCRAPRSHPRGPGARRATDAAGRVYRPHESSYPRRKEVLELLISGKSLKEIAGVREVTVQTIWKHRLSILQKMGVQSDLELVRVATRWEGQRRE